jgi:hypothetical protein
VKKQCEKDGGEVVMKDGDPLVHDEYDFGTKNTNIEADCATEGGKLVEQTCNLFTSMVSGDSCTNIAGVLKDTCCSCASPPCEKATCAAARCDNEADYTPDYEIGTTDDGTVLTCAKSMEYLDASAASCASDAGNPHGMKAMCCGSPPHGGSGGPPECVSACNGDVCHDGGIKSGCSTSSCSQDDLATINSHCASQSGDGNVEDVSRAAAAWLLLLAALRQ